MPIALAGGLSLLFGYHAKLGACVLMLFLVPVTLAMHGTRRAASRLSAAAAVQSICRTDMARRPHQASLLSQRYTGDDPRNVRRIEREAGRD